MMLKPEIYKYNHTQILNRPMPRNAVFQALPGECVNLLRFPSNYIPLEDMKEYLGIKDDAPLDSAMTPRIAMIEEVANGIFVNSLQVTQLLTLRGFEVTQVKVLEALKSLAKRRFLTTGFLVKAENLTAEEQKNNNALMWFSLDCRGSELLKRRGYRFNKRTMFVPFCAGTSQINPMRTNGEALYPEEVKREFAANMIKIGLIASDISMDYFGRGETHRATEIPDDSEEKVVLVRTNLCTSVDGSAIDFDVCRDTEKGMELIVNKVGRYLELVHSKAYLEANYHNQGTYFQMIVCGENLEHNKKIKKRLSEEGLWSEEDPILFTEDLLHIHDSAKSVYALDEEDQQIWYELPVKTNI